MLFAIEIEVYLASFEHGLIENILHRVQSSRVDFQDCIAIEHLHSRAGLLRDQCLDDRESMAGAGSSMNIYSTTRNESIRMSLGRSIKLFIVYHESPLTGKLRKIIHSRVPGY